MSNALGTFGSWYGIIRDGLRADAGEKKTETPQRVRKGRTVWGLQKVKLSPGPEPDQKAYIVPAIGGHPGLPGLYSEAWPTPIEAKWLDRAREAASRGGFELVELDEAAIRGTIRRLKVSGDPLRSDSSLDNSAIAEEVASRYPRREPIDKKVLGAERSLHRALEECSEWEYTFPGSEDVTGRRRLPD